MANKMNEKMTEKLNNLTHNPDLKMAAAIGLILLGAILRIIPHSPNFTAIGAMALLSGFYISSILVAMAIPLAALLVSDLVLGFHPTMIFVYGAFALVVLVSRAGKNLGAGSSKLMNVMGLLGLTLTGSALFFVITNFGVWMTSGMYPMTAAGLVQSMIMGLPFLDNQVLGDLFYTGLAFAGVELLLPRTVKA